MSSMPLRKSSLDAYKKKNILNFNSIFILAQSLLPRDSRCVFFKCSSTVS